MRFCYCPVLCLIDLIDFGLSFFPSFFIFLCPLYLAFGVSELGVKLVRFT